MDIRWLKEGDYDGTLVKWWKDWEWTAPPKSSLPDDGLGGLMVYKDDVDICAGFLYQTNSKTAWLEFIVSNKEYRGKDRKEALELLINVLSIKAKELGYTTIYTSLTHNGLIKRYENCGFLMGSQKCTEMIKTL